MATAPTQAASHLVGSDTLDRNNPSLHKRTYQACIPCRRRKVRCDLGPVDDPHEPPCVRCRRESKECYFSATRRKRKTEDGDGLADGGDAVDDDYAERNSRRRISLNQTLPLNRDATVRQSQRSLDSGSQPSTPPGATYDLNNRELPPPSNPYYGDVGGVSTETSQDQEVTNDTAAALFQSPINNPGDALYLLLEASGRTEDINRQKNRPQSDQDSASLNKDFATPQIIYNNGRRPYDGLVPALSSHPTNIDPAIITGHITEPHSIASEVLTAVKAWSRLRFVRAGWLTATEAMSYLDYFYRHLAPLTPISPPDFRSPATHSKLLNEEPMLTVTILTIAARYKKLTGLGGHSRSYMIHDRLWVYLQSMITRMFWGQEQFGGGFCCAGSRKVDQKAAGRGGLRTMGTIESLLLLSEFHPRSMHFPPGDDDNEILAPSEEDLAMNNDDTRETPSSGENTISGWTEPALRSDRMCWSLVSTAYALAYELSLFGNFSDGMRTTTDVVQHRGGVLSESQRAERVKRLLFVYVTQTSGRLGFPSMFSEHVHGRGFVDVELDSLQGQSQAAQSSVETIQRCWAGITTIMKTTNTKLFPSKERTRELIKSGEYLSLLQRHQPILTLWKNDFDSLHVEKLPKVILSMEFEYARVYCNSLALQAVLEHWTSRVGASHSSERSATSSLAALYRQNEYYINECVDASRTLLRHLVNGLLPEDSLKHAPTRTYFRILSGAMFLLKTFALGAKEEEVAISLQLLDDTVKALRTSVVDDVHLCLRIADLLERLTSSIRNKFVRLAAPTARRTTSSSRKRRGKYPHMAAQQDSTDNSARYLSSNTNNVGSNNPLAGISTNPVNPQDDNISIMPPPNDIYNMNPYITSSNPHDFNQQSFDHQQPHLCTNDDTLSPQVSEEDWLTLNLNPLLSDTTGYGNGESENWFGDFGPEIINNLEVLGKFVDGYEPGGVGFS